MALRVAEQDTDRIPKALAAVVDAGDGQVAALSYASIAAEAGGIAEICRQLVDEEGVRVRDILILLRNDPYGIYSDPIVEALAGQGLDAELPSDPFAVLDEPLPRQAVCLLRLMRNRADGLAWAELLRLRDNGVGEGACIAVYRLADARRQRYYSVLREVSQDPDILDHSRRRAVAEDVQRIEDSLDDLGDAFSAPADQGLNSVLDAIGFPLGDERSDIEGFLIGLLSQRNKEQQTLDALEEALHSSRGAMDEAERDTESERVQIMTMHTAKGLTADAVIVAGCDDQLMPGNTANRRELDDQRRLLYVSLTRARHFLFVTFARARIGQQSHRLRVPERRTDTRFLRDFLPTSTS